MNRAISFLKTTYSAWSDHQAPRLGASVAFYSILSFAPLLVLITALIALIFGHESAQGAIIGEARELIGEHGAETVKTLLANAQKPASGVFASLVAFVTLLFGASGVFTELQSALNLMWDAKAPAASGFVGMVRQRLFSFGMVLSVGFLLLVSLLLSAGLAFLGHSFGQLVPVPPVILQAINFAVSFLVVASIFALMFRYMPAAKVGWNQVIPGALGTALLFTIGKLLLGLYLGKASVGSTYGAGGSLVAVVVWIYYSAQIFFFGAEFTYLLGQEGSKTDQAPTSDDRKLEVPDRPAVIQHQLPAKAAPIGEAAAPLSLTQPTKATGPQGSISVVNLNKPVSKRPTVGLLVLLAMGFLAGRASKGSEMHPSKKKSEAI